MARDLRQRLALALGGS